MTQLVTHKQIAETTYGNSVVAGLTNIKNTMYHDDVSVDRHVLMPIPNSLALEEGTEANKFLKRAGALNKDTSAGVPVTVSEGQTFISAKTQEEDTLVVLDFEYTEATDLDKVSQILND